LATARIVTQNLTSLLHWWP